MINIIPQEAWFPDLEVNRAFTGLLRIFFNISLDGYSREIEGL